MKEGIVFIWIICSLIYIFFINFWLIKFLNNILITVTILFLSSQ